MRPSTAGRFPSGAARFVLPEAAAHPAVARPGDSEDMAASGPETRPTDGSNGAGRETRGHGRIPNLRSSRPCRVAAAGNDEDSRWATVAERELRRHGGIPNLRSRWRKIGLSYFLRGPRGRSGSPAETGEPHIFGADPPARGNPTSSRQPRMAPAAAPGNDEDLTASGRETGGHGRIPNLWERWLDQKEKIWWPLTPQIASMATQSPAAENSASTSPRKPGRSLR